MKVLTGLFFLFFLQQTASFEEARRAADSQQWEKALRLFEQIVTTDPDNGEAHYYLAQIHVRLHDDQQAIASFRRALELLPNVELIWAEYGNWLLRSRYLDESRNIFDHLTTIRPDNPEYWLSLGKTYYEDGRPSEALESYRRGLQLAPHHVSLGYLSAVAARSLGRFAESEAFLRQGLKQAPEHVEMRFQLAELLLQLGRVEESLQLWNKLPENEARFVYGKGLAAMHQNKAVKAEAFFLRALELNPAHTRAAYQLGILYSRQQDQAKASRFFRLFRKLEKQDRESRKWNEKKIIVERP